MEDEEMSDTAGEFYTVHEIDLDYEFDACRYFDFSREESLLETRRAELWFDSVPSYPPSPFAAKMVLGESFNTTLGNVNVSPKGKVAELEVASTMGKSLIGSADVEMTSTEETCGGMFKFKSGSFTEYQGKKMEPPSGFTFYNHMAEGIPKGKLKPTVKPSFPRKSTLMKPTASQLAKQNRIHKTDDSRFLIPLVQNNVLMSDNSSTNETQAAKRQKLEGGHLRKVTDMLQQTTLVHKMPRKDGIGEGSATYAKLKLTIPREPEFRTTNRAHRTRLENRTAPEQVTSTAYRFRARPLNRKILEAPSLPLLKKSTPILPEFQVFHLKTSERAEQHTSAVSSSSLHGGDIAKDVQKSNTSSVTEKGNKDFRRPIPVDTRQQDGTENLHQFKALPLNRKILSSKGDIGVFRTRKKDTTVPMEFKFQTEKRIHNPPVELFNKLCLTSELQHSNGNQFKMQVSQPSGTNMKGSKENRYGLPRKDNELSQLVKERTKCPEQLHCGGDRLAERSLQSVINRRLGIR